MKNYIYCKRNQQWWYFHGVKKTITFIVLTILMSLGLSVFRACMAASSAGMASAKSLSHSSFIPLATAAASLATASSAATTLQYRANQSGNAILITLLLTNPSWYSG